LNHVEGLARQTWSDRLKNLREFGLWIGLLYLAKRALEAITRGYAHLYVYYLVAQPVSVSAILPPDRGRSIQVREIGVAECLTLSVERPRSVFEDRFRQGARCLVATKDDRFLGFLWFLTLPYEEDEVRCRFVPEPEGRASWDFDVFVEPSARLSLAFARLWDEANRILSSRGVAWSISRISAFNPGSLASHRRLGLKRVGTAVFLIIGPMQFTLCSLRPYVHMAWLRSQRPTIRVRAD
jgi:hypothetical protein